jgi:hypothetical protein
MFCTKEKQCNQGSEECSLLRIVSLNIQENCGLSAGRINATITMKNGVSKDVFTKLLTSIIFGQLIQKIDLHRFRDGCMVEGEK